MIRSKVHGLFAACVVVFALAWQAQANAVSSREGRFSSTHVYMLTGLLGVQSGLDGVAAKIRQRGLPTTMSSPGGWDSLAQSAIEDYRSGRLRSIIIVGYSAGGRSALDMAAQLNQARVPIQLVVILDGMSGPPVAPNVRKLVNFYVPGGFGSPIERPSVFRGTLQNIPARDPRTGHFTIIDANERQLLSTVLSAAH